jgi:hypothetical protein
LDQGQEEAEEVEVMMKGSDIVDYCKDCGKPITRYHSVGYPFCEECRAAYRRRKYRERMAKRPYSNQKADIHCPNAVLHIGEPNLYCFVRYKSTRYCQTVRQMGECPRDGE